MGGTRLVARTGAGGPEAAPDRVWFAQAVRGFACLMVLWAHLGESFFLAPSSVAQLALLRPVAPGHPPWLGSSRALLDAGIDTGYVGVALFLLTSGFVIPFSLRRRNLRSFFVRRVFRIYPVYWLALCGLLVLLAWHAHHAGVAFPYGPRAIVTNLFLVNGYFRIPSIDAVNWTLAVEELFYAIAAVLATRHLLHRRWVLLAVACTFVVLNLLEPRFRAPGAPHGLVSDALPMLAYYGSLVVFVFIGVVLHHWYCGTWRPARAVTTGALLLGGFLIAVANGPVHTLLKSFVVSYLVALVAFTALCLVHDRVPTSRAVDRLAEISYPLYLVHGIAGYVLMAEIIDHGGSWVVALPTAAGVAIVTAAIVHRVVERPVNDLGRRLASGTPARQRDRARPRRQPSAPGDGGSGSISPIGSPNDIFG